MPHGSINDDYLFASISASTQGNNTIQAALGKGFKIRVISLWMISAGTTLAAFESNADGTALSGRASLAVNSGFVLDYNPAGWFETAANELLNLELSEAIQVSGSLTYLKVAV